MRKLFFVITTILLSSNLYSQEKNLVDKRKKDSLIHLISKYKKQDRFGDIPYLSRADRLSKKSDLKSLEIQLLNRMFYHHLSKNDLNKSEQNLKVGLELYSKKNNIYAYGNYFLLKGDFLVLKIK